MDMAGVSAAAVDNTNTQVLSEQELAAATLGLLVQPALWSSLRLEVSVDDSAFDRPWTTYWSTRLDPRLGAAQARQRFAAAFDAFVMRRDRIGELLCLAAIIEGFYIEEGPLDPLDEWIGALAERVTPDTRWPSDDVEVRVIACGVGIRLRDPSHPLLAAWAARGSVLVRRLPPGAGRLKLATFLVHYHLWRGEFGRAGVIVDALPGLDVQGLLPLEAMIWYDAVAAYARQTAQHQRGLDAVDAALRLARQHGMGQRDYALHAHGASVALAANDAARAQAHIDAMRAVLDAHPQADQTHYWHYLAGLTLMRGDATRAVELARTALENSGEIGGPTRLATHRSSLGQALLRAGEPALALECFDQALELARPAGAALLDFTATLMRGACLERLGQRDDAAVCIRSAWAEGARRDFRTTAAWWLPEVMTGLVRVALESDTEPAYVRGFVRLHRLEGPDALLAEWPWPLTLRAFGGFEATLNDASLASAAGKTAQRPLDLLRALLAHGATPLPAAKVMSWLWPDSPASAQRKAFDAALLRLRRMLDDARLLRFEGGTLRLDERWCWSDVGALHALMQRIGSAHGAALDTLQDWAQRLLDLMRGPFLGDEGADWIFAARERYRQRFVVTVAQLAAHLEPLDAAAAIRLYQRALEVEPLAESLSRRLMRLHAGRGDHAEALRAWRSCRSMLSLAAGLAPSHETRMLVRELGLPD
jgi:LuxR family maltose regulon positive regulatory protein